MTTYKLVNNPDGTLSGVGRSDGWGFLLHNDNTDYQQFKRDLKNGATLTDHTGTPMTSDQITEFLKGLA